MMNNSRYVTYHVESLECTKKRDQLDILETVIRQQH